nr:NAD-dependent epimerase/dehydratase family protein [uncultured Acetatifactor sp.]
MKILISGNEGFIGSSLEKKYREAGWDVFGWDIGGVTSNGEFWFQADMLNPSDAQMVIEKTLPDLILHCAGSADVGKSLQAPLVDLQGNYITTENILFALKKALPRKCRFILFSSAAVYGNPLSLPMNETQPLHPLSPYALHKRAAEEVCEFAHRNYLIDVKILRIFSVYGPGLRKQIFWDMYQKMKQTGKLELFGSGEESRDYIYIDDLVAAVRLIADKASFEDIYFNIANGEECTIREAAVVFAAKAGLRESNISFMGTCREGDPINWRADISRLKKLGYSRSVSFLQGISNYVDWVKGMG